MDVGQKIRRDAALLADDPEVSALFECLAEHLFDPALDSHFLDRECGAGRAVRDRLAARIGPLKVYVTELRMAEAARRVRDTETPVADIGRQLGYPVARTFRRTFQSTHGVSAVEMRRRARAVVGSPPEPAAAAGRDEPEPHDDEGLTPRALASRLRRRAALGLLDPRHAAGLRDRLRQRHPGLEGTREGSGDPARAAAGRGPAWEPVPMFLQDLGGLERFVTSIVVGKLLGLPKTDLRDVLLDGLRLGSTAAFDHLKTIAIELVPYAAERALDLAELYVRMIGRHRDLLADQVDDWQAMAWAHLANVRLCAGDEGGADQALGFAWVEAAEGGLQPWSEIEILRVEGRLRYRQRRHREATRALDRAVELSREVLIFEGVRLEAVLERLELASHAGDAEAGFELVHELWKLVRIHASRGSPLPLFHAFVFYHRGKAFAAAGDDHRAEIWFRRADRFTAREAEAHRGVVDRGQDLRLLRCFILHDLGRLAWRGDRLGDGESLLRAALEGYRQEKIPLREALAEAELAVVCACRGRRDEARGLASASVAFFEGLPFHREAESAARRLQTLADGDAEADGGKLREMLAALCRELDLMAWEIGADHARSTLDTRSEEA